MKPRTALAWACILYAILSLACVPREDPTTPTTVIVTQNNNSNNSVPTPGASPSVPPGNGVGRFDLRVNPFGFSCPAGTPAPRNNDGVIPVDCVAAFTVTPKIPGTATDAPGPFGTPEWRIPSGQGRVSIYDYDGNPFNRNVKGLAAGDVQISVALDGVVGTWSGRVQ